MPDWEAVYWHSHAPTRSDPVFGQIAPLATTEQPHVLAETTGDRRRYARFLDQPFIEAGEHVYSSYPRFGVRRFLMVVSPENYYSLMVCDGVY